MKKNIQIPENLHTELKILATKNNKSIQFIVQEALEKYLYLVSLAHDEGNEYHNIPETIDELFECEATLFSIREKLSQFAEETKEEIN